MREASGRPLRALLEGSAVRSSSGDLDVLVSGVSHDSRRVGPGDLFCAVDGARCRGLDFARAAAERGAVAVLAEGEPADLGVTTVVVDDVRHAMALASSAVFGHPSARVPTVGITGTNGKTTTTYLVEGALRGQGVVAGVVGTINARVGAREWPAALTTPEAPDLHRLAAEMVEGGAAALLMEVSSHGIELRRTRGIRYRVVAFTNLTQDHLDFHGDMERYGAAKLRLFTEELAWSDSPVAVVNIDDAFGARVADAARCPVSRVSAEGRAGADVRVLEAEGAISGVRVRCDVAGQIVEVRSRLVGHHNVANIAMALGIVHGLGAGDLEAAARGISEVAAVPGRLEPVPDPRGAAVLVDYAHSPDAIDNVVRALRGLCAGRLFVVFGCGGDRDRKKRPLMGRAAGAADLVVVTSDNPRTEDPVSIIDMAVPGVRQSGLPEIGLEDLALAERGFAVEVDRRRAIRAAVSAARPGDVVLVAGKGHEPYQILGERKVHFDDREEAEAAIRSAVERGEGDEVR